MLESETISKSKISDQRQRMRLGEWGR